MKANPSLVRRASAVAITASMVAASGFIAVSSASAASGNSATANGAVGTGQILSQSQLPKTAHLYTGALPKPGATGTTFPTTTSSNGVTTRVVSGSVVDTSAYPGVVGVVEFIQGMSSTGSPELYENTCTGTVVSATQVLTTGTCEADEAFATTFVIAGRDTLTDNTSGFVAQVRSTWTDPNLNLAALNAGTATFPVNDIGLLNLWTALPAAYTPVSLSAQGNQTPYVAGTSATTVGYGMTSPNDVTSLGVLNAGTVAVQPDATCLAANSSYSATTLTCAGTPAGGTNACYGDQGGPLYVNGVEVAIADWVGSTTCTLAGAYTYYDRLSNYATVITAAMAQPAITNQDFNGDGHSDIMAIDSSGNLLEYGGDGFVNDGNGGFGGEKNIGSGWSGFRQVFRVTNWNDDNTQSIMAVSSNGNLDEWTTNGEGQFATGNAILIGTGWNIFSSIMVVSNWTGDGAEDLIGVMSNGNLRLYESNGAGGWINPAGVQIGTGWAQFNTILPVGTWNGDGNQTLLARTSNGNLYMYESNEAGGWVNPSGTQIGTSWNTYKTLLYPGDWDGDGNADLIGITSAGAMNLYQTNGKGKWITGAAVSIGTGWKFPSIF